MRILCCIGIAVAAPGCGPSAHEVQLRQLGETVATLQAQVAHQNDRNESLANRLTAIAGRLDVLQRPNPRNESGAPHLEVVRLVPEAPPAAAPQVNPEPEAAPIEIRLTGNSASNEKVSAPRADGGPSLLFRRALEAYRGGQSDVAYARFAEFSRSFPKHEYADNALYWMGECRFERAQYHEALADFERVLSDYPGSKKAPDALLKMGLAYERLALPGQARGSFERVIASFPDSALAELARARLITASKSKGASP